MNQFGIRYGQRTKQTREKDLDDKIRLVSHIRKKYGISAFRDRYIQFDNGKVRKISETVEHGCTYTIRNPDIIVICKLGVIVVELDGKVHRFHEVRTSDRNKLYDNAGLKYIVLNTSNVISEFDGKFAELLANPSIRPPELA